MLVEVKSYRFGMDVKSKGKPKFGVETTMQMTLPDDDKIIYDVDCNGGIATVYGVQTKESKSSMDIKGFVNVEGLVDYFKKDKLIYDKCIVLIRKAHKDIDEIRFKF